jgi:hypothetical protein
MEDDGKPAFTFVIGANSPQLRAFLENFTGFEAEWEAIGYEVLTGEQTTQRLSGKSSVPDEWRTKGITASAFGPPHFFQFLAFLKEPATTAVLEVFIAGILHAALKRFGGVFGAHSDKHPHVQFPIMFCPALFFEREEVLVTIVAEIGSPADFQIAELLVPEGFQRAAAWLEHHGVTHPYLTYFIHNSNLDARPTLSDRPPLERSQSADPKSKTKPAS